jgi:hypothetical protein
MLQYACVFIQEVSMNISKVKKVFQKNGGYARTGVLLKVGIHPRRIIER